MVKSSHRYEAPKVEIIDIETQSVFCVSANTTAMEIVDFGWI